MLFFKIIDSIYVGEIISKDINNVIYVLPFKYGNELLILFDNLTYDKENHIILIHFPFSKNLFKSIKMSNFDFFFPIIYKKL